MSTEHEGEEALSGNDNPGEKSLARFWQFTTVYVVLEHVSLAIRRVTEILPERPEQLCPLQMEVMNPMV